MHNYPFNLCCNMARVNRWNSHITISPYSIFDLWHKGQKVILLQYMETRELIHASSKCYRSFGHPCRQDLVQWRSKSRPLPGRLHAQVETIQFMLIFNYCYTNIISIQFNPQPPKPLNFIIYLIKKKLLVYHPNEEIVHAVIWVSKLLQDAKLYILSSIEFSNTR